MKTLDERLKRISDAADRAKREEKEKADAFTEKVKATRKAIKDLAPRVRDIIDVATQMHNHGISIGKFVSNGIYHTLGLMVEYGTGYPERKPLGIGIEGGGYAGCDFVVGREGYLIGPQQTKDGYYYDVNTEESLAKGERFLKEFDHFEQTFYEYVDSL